LLGHGHCAFLWKVFFSAAAASERVLAKSSGVVG
jgi:hypothetical protein